MFMTLTKSWPDLSDITVWAVFQLIFTHWVVFRYEIFSKDRKPGFIIIPTTIVLLVTS